MKAIFMIMVVMFLFNLTKALLNKQGKKAEEQRKANEEKAKDLERRENAIKFKERSDLASKEAPQPQASKEDDSPLKEGHSGEWNPEVEVSEDVYSQPAILRKKVGGDNIPLLTSVVTDAEDPSIVANVSAKAGTKRTSAPKMSDLKRFREGGESRDVLMGVEVL